MDLNGKHALITGGGTGIGLAIAKALAEAGAEVTITGRRKEVLDQVAGGRIHALAMDVADEKSVVEGFAQAVAERGPIAICVANAGIAEGKALVEATGVASQYDLNADIQRTCRRGAGVKGSGAICSATSQPCCASSADVLSSGITSA